MDGMTFPLRARHVLGRSATLRKNPFPPTTPGTLASEILSSRAPPFPEVHCIGFTPITTTITTTTTIIIE
ncbi:hypothetical protein CTAM01_05941 [Colletotrichum tamarilloi]|uniref:Uncharacterized protein n=1 Tax=Colletotrichum tamarilloi TaxID=1209934 RepID=A0ABQ9RCJ2_9PEZI|nr:uncharacterized protein CTAM01_05941 [Colletotrichum tamarilloi]KAK1501216.1 hypothetical protein CTAM01_05941 [Colletotrichum tamarilloi]